MLVCSYYTPSYAGHAERLVASLDAVGLAHAVEPIAEARWEEATLHKPTYLLEHWTGGPLVWIDADAEVRYPLDYLEPLDEDFAIHARFVARERLTHSPFRSGTVYLSGSPQSRELVERWQRECKSQPDGIDQWALWRAWVALLPTTEWLPLSYCAKPEESLDPVVAHFVASRHAWRRG